MAVAMAVAQSVFVLYIWLVVLVPCYACKKHEKIVRPQCWEAKEIAACLLDSFTWMIWWICWCDIVVLQPCANAAQHRSINSQASIVSTLPTQRHRLQLLCVEYCMCGEYAASTKKQYVICLGAGEHNIVGHVRFYQPRAHFHRSRLPGYQSLLFTPFCMEVVCVCLSWHNHDIMICHMDTRTPHGRRSGCNLGEMKTPASSK